MAAPHRLGGVEVGELPKSVATAGISDRPDEMALSSILPPLGQRIAAVERTC